MQWEFILALVLAIPILLFPVAFVWYLNIGGLYRVMHEARQQRKRRVKALRDVQTNRNETI